MKQQVKTTCWRNWVT